MFPGGCKFLPQLRNQLSQNSEAPHQLTEEGAAMEVGEGRAGCLGWFETCPPVTSHLGLA